ncbi:hypothetical protein MHYP_G00004410 [Metynnis hypsauchen]
MVRARRTSEEGIESPPQGWTHSQEVPPWAHGGPLLGVPYWDSYGPRKKRWKPFSTAQGPTPITRTGQPETVHRKLTPAEQRYAALEREALAIKELRFYLTGRGGVPKTLMEWSTWLLGGAGTS